VNFVLRITMDNDAFADNPGQELERLLTHTGAAVAGLMLQLEPNHLDSRFPHPVLDANGNTVGSWVVER